MLDRAACEGKKVKRTHRQTRSLAVASKDSRSGMISRRTLSWSAPLAPLHFIDGRSRSAAWKCVISRCPSAGRTASTYRRCDGRLQGCARPDPTRGGYKEYFAAACTKLARRSTTSSQMKALVSVTVTSCHLSCGLRDMKLPLFTTCNAGCSDNLLFNSVQNYRRLLNLQDQRIDPMYRRSFELKVRSAATAISSLGETNGPIMRGERASQTF
jgi:hypothetical protein